MFVHGQMRILAFLVTISIGLAVFGQKGDDAVLTFVETTDVHGNFFPYDFISGEPGNGSLARVASFVNHLRDGEGTDNVVLLDNGDILQGQPSAYYYNFIDTISTHLASCIYNYMNYDAVTIGNHDVETGPYVYNRWISRTNAPVLGANVLDAKTGRTKLKPYVMIERQGIRVAVLGLLTPAIPSWLPENLWTGLCFESMVESARKWVDIIKAEEKPDAIVGLFHSGADSTRLTGGIMENASVYIAENVPGFNVVFFGHDHRKCCRTVKNSAGEDVLVLNPANNAMSVAVAKLVFKNGKFEKTEGELVDIDGYEPSSAFIKEFEDDFYKVKEFVDRKIGVNTCPLPVSDSYFGPSAFMQLIHELQLRISGADISFAAPLSFNGEIKRGDLKVADMFTLYKYENMLYGMKLSGREIKNYLEKAYSLWCAEPSDSLHLLMFESSSPNLQNNRLKNSSYNFDSAYGIDYTVDITKPYGDKINIIGFSDGRPFDEESTYIVALNSYRGNGGGDLLTQGAGIPQNELKDRIVTATDKDLRYYLLKEIEAAGVIDVKFKPNWKFIPEAEAERRGKTDKELLFSAEASKIQK